MTAYVMKFVALLKSKVRRSDIVTRTITAVDVENAELFWVRLSQGMLTQDERFGIWQQQLGLYSGANGVWRCQGRLHHADLPQAGRHPIILDRRHHFTVLVVQDCHTKVMHNGVKETLTEIRSRYWIVRGRQFMRKLLIKCRICKRFGSKPFAGPTSPPLPSFSVQESPPFSTTGVDYAGPLYVKGGGKV